MGSVAHQAAGDVVTTVDRVGRIQPLPCLRANEEVAPIGAIGSTAIELAGSSKDGVSRRLRLSMDDERASPSVTMIGSRSAWPRASRKERSDGAFCWS